MARHGVAIEPLPVKVAQEVHDMLASHRLETQAALFRKSLQLAQIVVVSRQRIGGQALLDLDVIHERNDQRVNPHPTTPGSSWPCWRLQARRAWQCHKSQTARCFASSRPAPGM